MTFSLPYIDFKPTLWRRDLLVDGLYESDVSNDSTCLSQHVDLGGHQSLLD